ncbi:MAG: ribosomal protein L16 [Bacteroidetes bacterium]|nr:ribosomal protein L16 [Bacteroidota bacterium]
MDEQLLILRYGVFGRKRTVSLADARHKAKMAEISGFRRQTKNTLVTPKHNLQRLHKIQSQFKQKTRKRRFKTRVTNGWRVRESARFSSRPRRFLFRGFRTTRACRLTFKALIGAEKSIMATKSKVWVRYRKYPNFFTTRKSSKSRMGKGKGKIAGRVAKIQRGEVLFEGKIAHHRKSRKWVSALKQTMPSTLQLVYHSKPAERTIKNFYRSRPWYAIAKKFKKRKRHLIQKKKYTLRYDYPIGTELYKFKYHRIYCTWRELEKARTAGAFLRYF